MLKDVVNRIKTEID